MAYSMCIVELNRGTLSGLHSTSDGATAEGRLTSSGVVCGIKSACWDSRVLMSAERNTTNFTKRILQAFIVERQ